MASKKKATKKLNKPKALQHTKPLISTVFSKIKTT
jgi:hypothetical protein